MFDVIFAVIGAVIKPQGPGALMGEMPGAI
jgi:hypothetical protein